MRWLRLKNLSLWRVDQDICLDHAFNKQICILNEIWFLIVTKEFSWMIQWAALRIVSMANEQLHCECFASWRQQSQPAFSSELCLIWGFPHKWRERLYLIGVHGYLHGTTQQIAATSVETQDSQSDCVSFTIVRRVGGWLPECLCRGWEKPQCSLEPSFQTAQSSDCVWHLFLFAVSGRCIASNGLGISMAQACRSHWMSTEYTVKQRTCGGGAMLADGSHLHLKHLHRRRDVSSAFVAQTANWMSSWLGEGNLQVRWPIATGGWIAWVWSCVSAGFLGWQILHISTAQTLHIITYFALLEDDLISKPEFKLAFSLAATDLILVSCNSPMQVEVKHWVLEELSIFPFCVCRAQSICSNCSRQTWRSMLYDIMRSLHDRFWNNSQAWAVTSAIYGVFFYCHVTYISWFFA